MEPPRIVLRYDAFIAWIRHSVKAASQADAIVGMFGDIGEAKRLAADSADPSISPALEELRAYGALSS